MNLGFTKSKVDSNLYYNVVNDGIMILLLYVDDLFSTREEKLINKCKKNIAEKFEMKDLGMMHYIQMRLVGHCNHLLINEHIDQYKLSREVWLIQR